MAGKNEQEIAALTAAHCCNEGLCGIIKLAMPPSFHMHTHTHTHHTILLHSVVSQSAAMAGS